MFDSSAASVRLDQWLRQRLFCVDSREYNLAATLKYLANKEAAHVDTENTILSQDMESVHFGNTCYYHFVAILTSAYLLAQFKHSVQANKTEWQYLLDRRGYTVTERGTFLDAELSGLEIEPMGLPHAFHETGISIPHPGWTPVHIDRDSPDQTNFPGNSSFWDTVKYNPAFQGRQMRPDSLKFPVFI